MTGVGQGCNEEENEGVEIREEEERMREPHTYVECSLASGKKRNA